MTDIVKGKQIEFCSSYREGGTGPYKIYATKFWITKVFKNGNFKISGCTVSFARIGDTNCAAPVTTKGGISQHLIVVL